MPELIRFGIVGLMGTALYALVYAIAFRVLASISLATFFAFLISLIFSYIAQSRFTFRAQILSWSQSLRYILVIAVIGMIFTCLSFLFGSVLGEWGWLFIVIITYPILSYLGHKYYTYSDVRFWGVL